MILLIIAFAFLIISTFFIYKTAKENGYNAVLWAGAAFLSFVGVYIVLSTIIVVVVLVGISKLGWAKNTFENLAIIVDFFVMAASGASVMLILRHVAKIKDEEYLNEEPPPPPDFDKKD